jgi:hypothetical protein
MVTLTIPPGTELAELNETVACCATAGLATMDKSSKAFEARPSDPTTLRNFNEHLQNLMNLL